MTNSQIVKKLHALARALERKSAASKAWKTRRRRYPRNGRNNRRLGAIKAWKTRRRRYGR